MPIGLGLGALIGGIAGAGSSVVGGILGSRAAGKAATTQAEAATYAADLTKQAADKSLAEQQRQFDTQQANLAPWLQTGQAGLSDLARGMGIETPATSSFRTSTFPSSNLIPSSRAYELQGQMPELQNQLEQLQQQKQQLSQVMQSGKIFNYYQAKNAMPAIDAQIQQLQGQMQQNQSELSTLVQNASQEPANEAPVTTTPAGSSIALGQFNQPFEWNPDTDPSYQFRFGEGQEALERSAAAKGMPFGGSAARAQTRYGQDYASQEYDRSYQRYQSEQSNRFNRLAALAGIGQTATTQANQSSQAFANNTGNILTNSAAQQGDYATQAANARASGYANSANAWGNAISGATNNLFGGLMLSDLFNKKNASV